MKLLENNTGLIYEIKPRKDGGLNVRVYQGETLLEVFSIPPWSKSSFLDKLLQRSVVIEDD